MDLQLTDKVAVITGSSRGLGLAARARSSPRAAASSSARAAPTRSTDAAPRAADAGRHDAVLRRAGGRVDAEGVRGARRARGRALRRPRHARQQRRQGRRRRHRSTRPTPSGRPRSTRRCFPRSARRASPCRTCGSAAAASIVMIASIWGRESGGRMTYNAVKAAEISLAKSIAQQLAPINIRVNSVAPGSILFPGGSWCRRQQADPEGIAEFVAPRAAVRPLRPPRRSRRRRRVPRLAARQLDHRRVRPRRRLPGPVEYLKLASPSEPLTAWPTADSDRLCTTWLLHCTSSCAVAAARRRHLCLTLRHGVRAGAALRRGVRAMRRARRRRARVGVLTPFQAFMTALGASIGTGNIAGVATAIVSGGPGRALLDLGLRLRRDGDQVRRGRARHDVP